MKEVYVPEFLEPYEVVDRTTYEMFKNHPVIIWRMFNPDILRWADWMRNRYGPIIVNNWFDGGDREWSGLRNPNSPWYSPGSMHSIGEALDMKFVKIDAQSVIKDLQVLKYVPYVTRIEDKPGMSWVHGDIKLTNKSETHFFLP